MWRSINIEFLGLLTFVGFVASRFLHPNAPHDLELPMQFIGASASLCGVFVGTVVARWSSPGWKKVVVSLLLLAGTTVSYVSFREILRDGGPEQYRWLLVANCGTFMSLSGLITLVRVAFAAEFNADRSRNKRPPCGADHDPQATEQCAAESDAKTPPGEAAADPRGDGSE